MTEEKKERYQICVPVSKVFKENVEKQMRRKAYEEDRKITYVVLLEEALGEYFGIDLTQEEKPKKRKKKDDE